MAQSVFDKIEQMVSKLMELKPRVDAKGKHLPAPNKI